MTIDDLREMLSDDILTVTFTKKNGETRVMRCTLIADYLPETNGKSTVPYNTNVTVWDMEKNAFRSFKFDSVTSVESDYFNYVVKS